MTEEQKTVLRESARDFQRAETDVLDTVRAQYRDAVVRLDEVRAMLRESQDARERLLDVLSRVRDVCMDASSDSDPLVRGLCHEVLAVVEARRGA